MALAASSADAAASLLTVDEAIRTGRAIPEEEDDDDEGAKAFTL